MTPSITWPPSPIPKNQGQDTFGVRPQSEGKPGQTEVVQINSASKSPFSNDFRPRRAPVRKFERYPSTDGGQINPDTDPPTGHEESLNSQ